MRRETETFVKQRITGGERHGQIVRINLSAHDTGIHRRKFRIHRRRSATGGQEAETGIEQTEQTLQIGFGRRQHVKSHQHHCGLLWRQNTGLMFTVIGLLAPAFIGGNGSGVYSSLAPGVFSACAPAAPPRANAPPNNPTPFNKRRREEEATSCAADLLSFLLLIAEIPKSKAKACAVGSFPSQEGKAGMGRG